MDVTKLIFHKLKKYTILRVIQLSNQVFSFLFFFMQPLLFIINLLLLVAKEDQNQIWKDH